MILRIINIFFNDYIVSLRSILTDQLIKFGWPIQKPFQLVLASCFPILSCNFFIRGITFQEVILFHTDSCDFKKSSPVPPIVVWLEMSQQLSIFTDDINDFFLVFAAFSPFFFLLQIITRDHILLVVVDSATLAGIELDSLNYFVDPIHRNYLLDILLFQETMQGYLKFLVVFHISFESFAFSHTETT